MASWLVHLTVELAVQIQALAGGIVLRFWATVKLLLKHPQLTYRKQVGKHQSGV